MKWVGLANPLHAYWWRFWLLINYGILFSNRQLCPYLNMNATKCSVSPSDFHMIMSRWENNIWDIFHLSFSQAYFTIAVFRLRPKRWSPLGGGGLQLQQRRKGNSCGEWRSLCERTRWCVIFIKNMEGGGVTYWTTLGCPHMHSQLAMCKLGPSTSLSHATVGPYPPFKPKWTTP